MEDFINVTLALNNLIASVYITDIEAKIPKLETKYKEQLFVSPGSLGELTDILKIAIKKILTLISKEYYTSLTQFFSEEGIIYYIESAFYKIITKE